MHRATGRQINISAQSRNRQELCLFFNTLLFPTLEPLNREHYIQVWWGFVVIVYLVLMKSSVQLIMESGFLNNSWVCVRSKIIIKKQNHLFLFWFSPFRDEKDYNLCKILKKQKQPPKTKSKILISGKAVHIFLWNESWCIYKM